MEAAKSKDSIQLLAEVTRELEYALAELWYHRRVSISSEDFDKEYGDMLQVAKEANLHLLEICSKFNKEIEMKRVIGRVEYEAVTGEYDTCEGCVGYSYDESTNDLCKKLRDDCDYKIWIKVDTKETQNKDCNMNQTSKSLKPHKHAEAMKLYAEDAATTDKPWELWEFNHKEECSWYALSDHPEWNFNYNYRRKAVKPKTININGYEVPEPLQNAPECNTLYWYPNTEDIHVSCSYYYSHYQSDINRLENGLIHLTKEAAQKHLEALLSFTRKDK